MASHIVGASLNRAKSGSDSRAFDQHDLEVAFEQNQLRLAFQPKVSLMTERMVGVEALLRWRHPHLGELSPLDFIPLAEESGLIVPIGRWVLEQASAVAARWRDTSALTRELIMSVNLSLRQLSPVLVKTVKQILQRSGLDPGLLCLELTESSMMRNPESTIAMLRQLKSLGVKLSIDDFGTGYSSLAHLRRFPLDELKVDKSFIDGLGTSPDATAIVAAVTGMAHALGLTVVAEGVETEMQLSSLRTIGCDEAQGYLFARPQSAEDTQRILASGAALPSRANDRSSSTAAARLGAGAGSVVVVDDAPDVRLLARMSLSAAGFVVHESAGGPEAVDLVRSVRPDCVLLDLNMPELGGLDISRSLRADPWTHDTTIVMVTTESQASDKIAAFATDVDDYIVKPFAPRELVSRITAAIRRRRTPHQRA